MGMVYLNGEFMPLEQARVPVMDRAFLFGDAVYEVLPVFAGKIFAVDEHLVRLERSLAEVRMANPLSRDDWKMVFARLVREAGGGHLSVYLQVSRGVAPTRDHPFPNEAVPTVFVMANPVKTTLMGIDDLKPINAVLCEDTRWHRCDIKSTALLANVLLKQQAADANAYEAILVRDGHAIEGAASNLFVVLDGVMRTAPNSPLILGGITRNVLLKLAAEAGIACREEAVTTFELARASEIWMTSSTREIMPVTQLDGKAVGDGRIGPVCRQLADVYLAQKHAFMAGQQV
ncbi:MAG: D-amino acid aminotransferase [Gammaproteobacteria bacterium]|nr:MAG: D-amino acid aminotransferase [Gammaproteobacteria bacterium]